MSGLSLIVGPASRTVLVALFAFFIAAFAAAQPAQPPRFESGVTLLQVSVSVVDQDGQVVRDLRPEDFEVEIDGTARNVLFARFAGSDDRTGARTPQAFLSNDVERPGRAVVFVIDLESMKAGYERPLLDTAARLIESLSDADAVSLVPFPGQAIDLTRDRARVASTLRQMRGTNSEPFYEYFVSMEEALAFERGDKRITSEVTERECFHSKSVLCEQFVATEALQRLAVERLHVQALLNAVTDVVRRLGQADAPRTIVLVSGGLGFEPAQLTHFVQVQRAVREARVNLYAIHVEQPDVDASTSMHGPTAMLASRDRQLGLANVASAAGGQFFAGIGTARGVFDRMLNEIAYAYILGIEIASGAPNTLLERLKVRAKRPKLQVRAVVQSGGATRDPDERLRTLMQQPIDATECPIAAMLYSVRGEESDTLKAILAAEIGRERNLEQPVRYALAVSRGDARIFETDGVARAGDDAARVNVAWQAAPGTYRLRLAAVDARGRGGSLDRPVSIGLRSSAEFQMSDLMLSASAASFLPAFVVPAGTPITGALEVYTADVQRFGEATVHFEVRRAAGDAVLGTTAARFFETDSDRRRVATADLATHELSPSEYTVSAVVSVAGRPVGKVSRSVRIGPSTPKSLEAASHFAAAQASLSARASDTTGASEAAAPVTNDPALNEVLRKLGAYVASYGPRASLVVAVEKYTQFVEAESLGRLPQRQLVAEFALVKTSDEQGWAGFRDVVEVDGRAVQDRRDRLLRLFTTANQPVPEATRIANESARFNVGPISRNFNVPTMALLLFTPSNLARFAFTRKGTDKIDGVETWVIGFTETARPTLVMTMAGKDVPCEGTLWVIPVDGTVVRTRLRLRRFADAFAMDDPRAPSIPAGSSFSSPGMVSAPPPGASTLAQVDASSPASGQGGSVPAGGPGGFGGAPSGGGGQGSVSVASGSADPADAGRPRPVIEDVMELPNLRRLESNAEIEVSYRRDARLEIWLPSRMSEEYSGPIPRARTAPLLGTSRTIATYGDYRQFDTSSKIIVPR
jgi:VWFA-related protein